jgi:DNA-binding MarR family transcriptional regulator
MAGLASPQSIHDLLNYRLMRLFAVSGAPVVRLCEGRYGISRREWRFIALLAHHGSLSPSALADQGDIDRARTSRIITSLVQKGLILRRPEPSNRQQAIVSLSPRGRALFEALFPQVADINRAVVAALDPDALAALDHALERLYEQALAVNQRMAQDVHADRAHGGSRRHWNAGPPGGRDPR